MPSQRLSKYQSYQTEFTIAITTFDEGKINTSEMNERKEISAEKCITKKKGHF